MFVARFGPARVVGCAVHEQKRAFLDMQFLAQKTDYTSRFPESEHSVILVDGEPVGRIWLDRGSDQMLLVDIALLPEARGRGTGTVLLRRLQREAEEATKPLRHSVYKTNVGALRLYERLGFEVIEDRDIYVIMEWTPERSSPRV